MISRIIIVVVLALFYTDVSGKTSYLTTTSSSACCACSPRPEVRITFKNKLQLVFFEHSTIVPYKTDKPLLYYLEHAARTFNIRYETTFFPNLGYMINSIKDVAGVWHPDRTYWKLVYENNDGLKLGVSSHIPQIGDHIIFNFTKSSW